MDRVDNTYIGRLFENLVVRTSKEMDGRVLADALAVFEESAQIELAGTGSKIWQIVRGRITKFAAAAVIILAVFIGMNVLIDPVEKPSEPIAEQSGAHEPGIGVKRFEVEVAAGKVVEELKRRH